MAIYRSDQAQFSFAPEAYDGGMPEKATPVTGDLTTSSTLIANTAAKAGDRFIYITNAKASGFGGASTNYAVISFDTTVSTSDIEDHGAAETVRVIGTEAGTGDYDVLHLATPLAFDHDIGATVASITSPGGSIAGLPHNKLDATKSKAYVTWIPGVYETVDAPDLEESFDARHMLADNSRRNPFLLVKGTQSFEGAVSGIVLLNGWPLRFALGEIDSMSIAAGGAVAGTTVANTKVIGSKGDVYVKLSISSGTANIATGSTLIINPPTASTYSTSATPARSEIVKVLAGGGSSLANNAVLEISQPLKYDHETAANENIVKQIGTAYQKHNIYAATKLPSMTWNINVKDENGENDFQRRYYGGKVGGLTVTAEEGGLVVCDWDSVSFMGMVHNQFESPRDSDTAGESSLPTGRGMRRYHPMLHIDKDDLGSPNTGDGLPSTSPYYFSEGNIKFFGTTVARLRSFSLTVNNGIEPRYYVRNARDDNRGPFEIKEGERSYSMTATIGLPDARTGFSVSAGGGVHNVFKELMLAGHYTDDTEANEGLVGFNIEIKFTRGNDPDDYIMLRIPEKYDGTAEAADSGSSQTGGPNRQGAFIQSAPINIDGSNPMEQSVNIMFSSLAVEISDKESFYP